MSSYLLLNISILVIIQSVYSVNFSVNSSTFLLNDNPFQIRAGELHYSRIPFQYWRHRIQMSKALGLNTISTYIMWNFHERFPGIFDFESDQANLINFMKIVQEEGMFLLIRPGPYVCAEWEFGGLPWWLLKYSNIKVRSSDPIYMNHVRNYVAKVSGIINSFQVTKGGPIIMLQVENEYGYYGNDWVYIEKLKKMWEDNGINVILYTADGSYPIFINNGSYKGAVIGLNPGLDLKIYEQAHLINPNATAFSAETYPGWLTHFGESWAGKSDEDANNEILFLMQNNKSFSSYMVHGGTNFGFWAGANYNKTLNDSKYQPTITSYDYNSPITENGLPTRKFYMMRNLIQSYINETLPPLPKPINTIQIKAFNVELYASIWDNLPKPIRVAQPLPMEMFNQSSGFILYSTNIRFYPSGINSSLVVKEVHDLGQVYLNDSFIGTVDRRRGNFSVTLPEIYGNNVRLDILVEAMGRINFGEELMDRKGITESVYIENFFNQYLMQWDVYSLPMEYEYVRNLKKFDQSTKKSKKGYFYKSYFNINEIGDTFLDLSNWSKGVVWVNGNNLGRYWNIGPQQRLYCPGVWLKKGINEIIIFDLYNTSSNIVKGEKTLIPNDKNLNKFMNHN